VDHALEAAVFVAWHDDEPLTFPADGLVLRASEQQGLEARLLAALAQKLVSPSTSNFSFTSAIRSLTSRKSHSLRTYRSS
jgi:hypothetical protein